MISSTISFAGRRMRLDPSGALLDEAAGLLIVADLHLETGSAFARRGTFLPPYDSMATIERLEALLRRVRPATVVSLGDAFHDRHGPSSLPAAAVMRLGDLMAGADWIWVRGNHDPDPPAGLPGRAVHEFRLGPLVFSHLPTVGEEIQVSGHLHPKAQIQGRRIRRSRRCFLVDERRMLLPAFGALTGGLNALDLAVRQFFPGPFDAWLLGEQRVFRFRDHQLVREAPFRR
jgi:uncharacterized protein